MPIKILKKSKIHLIIGDKMDFLFFYEHINREVENVSLIMHELQKRGYSCDIAHFAGPGLYKYGKKKNRASVVVTPWLRYDNNVFHYMQFARHPYKIVDLQWEQVYNKSGVDSGLVNVCDESLKAYHVCWGDNSKERLLSFGAPEENLCVCGAIQQDFGRDIFCDYYKSRQTIADEYGLDADKKWFLFVSSFSYVTYPDESIRKLAEQYGEHPLKFAELSKRSFADITSWIERLLSEQDCEFIYRPHPSEKDSDRLLELAARYSNFHVIRDFSVKQWAKVCDHVNSWISTSNAEIISMGVDYSTIRPIPVPHEMEMESMRGEEYVTTVEDFVKVNVECDNSPERIARRREQLGHFYNYDPDRAAYKRVADFLEEVYKSSKRCNYSFSLKNRLSMWLDEQKQRIVSYVIEKQMEHPEKELFATRLLRGAIRANVYNRISVYNATKDLSERVMCYMMEHE